MTPTPSPRYRVLDKMEDLSPEERDRFLEGGPVCASDEAELGSCYLQLHNFLEDVQAGKSWPWEKATLLKMRSTNLLERIPRL